MRVVWMLQLLLVLLVPSGIYAHAHRQDPPRALRGAGLLLASTHVDGTRRRGVVPPGRRHAPGAPRPTS